MLKERGLFGGDIDKVEIAIDRLKYFEPPDGYYLAFSGGKDSITIKKLADMAHVEYDAHYNNTTIDPPELVGFIKKLHPDVTIDNPPEAFLSMLVKKGFPRRQSRWCCEVYKEGGGKGRLVITGVRKQESVRRRNRRMLEVCMKDETKKFLNVIIDWTKTDVWEFIHTNKLPYCELYDKGFQRIGCLFCPNAKTAQRKEELKRYPKYAKAFILAFEKLYKQRKERGSKSVDRWTSGRDMFDWWIGGMATEHPDQTVMFE